MCAAIGGGDGVAIPTVGTIGVKRPGHCPFNAALADARIIGRKGLAAVEEIGGHAIARADLFLQMIGKSAGKLEYRLGWHIVAGKVSVAFPADFHACIQIRL